ncbi:unnamed protein product [Adineta steineri]|uniref:Uncharacterized protein n=1 Tax=Adineta steineri TaxID=433720 RepID=A0A815KZS9_9BILA|nr:unnamed protein product [Adineta steineri]CAF4087405.1 unnamed protein product [Adineta steineri]
MNEVGKMTLSDLYSLERGKDTASSDRLQHMEDRDDGYYVPFRGSILRKVLRDLFIGGKTIVFKELRCGDNGLLKGLPIDDEQDKALASYAAQVEHLQDYEDILANKEPILTKQLHTIIGQAQDTTDYDQEKFVNDVRTNLLQHQQMLNDLQTHLQQLHKEFKNNSQTQIFIRITKKRNS